jgi:hypothetical protein
MEAEMPIYLDFELIRGEAPSRTHAFEIKDFSFGVANTPTIGDSFDFRPQLTSEPAAAGTTISKSMEMSSPLLVDPTNPHSDGHEFLVSEKGYGTDPADDGLLLPAVQDVGLLLPAIQDLLLPY